MKQNLEKRVIHNRITLWQHAPCEEEKELAPKTEDSILDVPIIDPLVSIIEEIIAFNKMMNKSENDYFLGYNKYLPETTFRRKLDNMMIEADLAIHLTPHCLRTLIYYNVRL